MSCQYNSDYPKINYDYEKIKLNRIFENEILKEYPNQGIQTQDSKKVYGNLKFPDLPKDRAYTMAAFVTSIDGKVAYLDDPAGPVVAKSNRLDSQGAEADFWILNLMRANCDAIFAGAVTIQKEPDGTVCIFDKGLEKARVEKGLKPAPWVVVCSLDGTDIPFNDKVIREQDVIFNTSPVGLKYIEENMSKEYFSVGPFNSIDEYNNEQMVDKFINNKDSKIPIIATGQGKQTNSKVLLNILKLWGIDKAMVESPSYFHSLLKDKLLDEATLNYSCVYIGGDAVGLGKGMKPFTSIEHPHTEMLTIHNHSPSFFYFRHKFVYDVEPKI
ncbi:MAG: dihydrofolate reductase family protein [Candidatus Cloacimonetes bacterium]|nr:dihydrofolate reductase family protein [Candidatus Cloacimonadota bacterium]